MANLDIAFGLTPDMTLLDIFDGTGTIDEVICDGPEGVKLLPGCSGRYDVANLNEQERYSLFAAIDTLEDDFDILMVDTGAGLNSNAVAFAAAAQTVILVADPDPTSLADAYAFVKVMAQRCGIKKVALVANRVSNAKEGEDVYRKLSVLVNRFLQVGIDYLGYINTDAAISRATRGGVPVLMGEPMHWPVKEKIVLRIRFLRSLMRHQRRVEYVFFGSVWLDGRRCRNGFGS